MSEAEKTVQELLSLTEGLGGWLTRQNAQGALGIVLLYKGNMAEGFRLINDHQRYHLEKDYRWRYAVAECLMGRVYLQMVERAGPKSLSSIMKNIGFLIKNVPIAARKAESHFNQAIEVAEEIGAKGILGQAYLYLGVLHKAKKRIFPARECISEAVELFDRCHADGYLKQAKEALATLPN